MLKLIKRQVIILLFFSILISIAMIIHGVFFDLDISQIKRLTIEGLIITLFIVFPGILFLEWVFDLNNREEFKKLNEKINEKRK